MSSFRKDINGLRAIAVIAVVLFHFYPSLLTGGFAGVDVFFVISGFLMTGIIFRGVEHGGFSLLKYYVARANRIIPALAILCLTLLILGYFFLTSWDYKTVGRDVATSMLFISNVMFSMRGGYFDTGDNFLLHTWSLSVEWQFYIFYPVLIITLSKLFSIINVKRFVVFLCIFSFILSAYSTVLWPAESYFLLPTRAWEMFAGGIAYLYPLRDYSNKYNLNNKFLEFFGVFLIVISYVFVSENNLWPGYLAFFPVFGAWLIIQAHVNNSFFTGNIFLQKVGLWSYSIYLWHWPIAVSFSYYGISEKYKVLGIFLSIFFGYLSFTFIEKRKFISVSLVKPVFLYTIISMLFLGIGAIIFKTQGFAARQDLSSNQLIHGGVGNNYIVNEGVSFLNTDREYDYVLIGDSNSNHYTRGILNEGSRVKSSWYATCISFPNSISKRSGSYPGWKDNCKNNYKLGIDESVPVIIAQSWTRGIEGSLECVTDNCNLSGNYYDDLRVQLGELLETYSENKNIYLISELPKPKNNEIMTCLKANQLLGLSSVCNGSAKPESSYLKVNSVLKDVALGHSNVVFIDLNNALCEDGVCKYIQHGKSVFMTDGSHLSGYGSEFIWDYIVRHIK